MELLLACAIEGGGRGIEPLRGLRGVGCIVWCCLCLTWLSEHCKLEPPSELALRDDVAGSGTSPHVGVIGGRRSWKRELAS